MPIATPNCVGPLAFGSMRKPPRLLLKLGVNSIASESLLAKAFHFIQNSIVTLLSADRLSGADAAPVTPSKLVDVVVSPVRAPGWPGVAPPVSAPVAAPIGSARALPVVSPIRQ